jgi:hypothetical protein
MVKLLILLATMVLPAVADPADPPPPGPLGDRIAAVRDGALVFRYATRPGVRGNGMSVRLGDDGTGRLHTRGCWYEGAEEDLEEGPARVLVRMRRGLPHRLEARVGGCARRSETRAVDLGQVAPGEAADWLLDLAATTGDEDLARDAMLAACLAEGVTVWPALLDIARDGTRPPDIREGAVFWLGQEAGEAACAGLEAILDDEDEDLALREAALFALSLRPEAECVPLLLEVASESPSPALRRRALFWLGQKDDPRVLALFEAILAGDGAAPER